MFMSEVGRRHHYITSLLMSYSALLIFVTSSSYFINIVGLEQERTNLRAAKAGKIEKQSLQHDVNSATQATETTKLRWC